METVQRLVDGFQTALDLNASTLSGAIDIVVVKHPDGTHHCTPFHVRFGKFQLLRPKETLVSITVNDKPVNLKMRLGSAGEAFFVEESEEPVPPFLATSPITSPIASPKVSPTTSPKISPRLSGLRRADSMPPTKLIMDSSPNVNSGSSEIGPFPIVNQLDSSASKWSWSWRWGRLPVASWRTKQGDSSQLNSSTEVVSGISTPESPEGAQTPISQSPPESNLIEMMGSPTSVPPSSKPGWKSTFGSMFRIFNSSRPTYLIKSGQIDLEEMSVVDAFTAAETEQMVERKPQNTEQPKNTENYDSDELDDETNEEENDTQEQFEGEWDWEQKKTKSTDVVPFNPSEEKINTESVVLSQDDEKSAVPTSIIKLEQESFLLDSDRKLNVASPSVEEKSESSVPNEAEVSFNETNSVISQKTSSSDICPPNQTNQETYFIDEIQLEMSLCGNLLLSPNFKYETLPRIFEENRISYESFNANPEILFSNDLLFKLDNKIYPWNIAGPLVISRLVFRKPLEKSTIELLEKKFAQKIQTQQIQQKKGWLSWLWKSRATQVPGTESSTASTASTPAPSTASTAASTTTTITTTTITSTPLTSTSPSTTTTTKTTTTTTSSSTTSVASTVENDTKATVISTSTTQVVETTKVYAKKSLRPSSQQLASLQLREGENRITFSVMSKLWGIQKVVARIYQWKPDVQIVISDIDGTITRSDVFGQIMPFLGKDWSHSGVTQLYTNITQNGYQILYLSSRAIGQAGVTRGYLSSLRQETSQLPSGPVILSPDRLLPSFNREVIRRKPEEFKIACLKDILSVFPDGSRPYYAGFGNRETDAISYRAVGIPDGKIFTINPSGQLTTLNKTYRKTYSCLNDLVHEMFTSLHNKKPDQEEWNDWNYWKVPLPPIE